MSKTLIGSVRHDLYAVTSSTGVSAEWCAYEVESDVGAGRSVLRRTRCGLEAAVVQTHISDQKSDLTNVLAKDFHSTTAEIESPWTVTLAATATRGTERSVVLAAASTPAVVVNDRLPTQSVDRLLPTLDELYRLESGLVDRWVSSVLLVSGGQLLVVRTFRFPQYWQPVGGQAAADDHDPIATALREVAEETGLTLRADDLRPLGAVIRDRGSGMVHGFAADVPSNWAPDILESEIAEHRWMYPDELAGVDCFDATRHFALEFARRGQPGTVQSD